MDKFSFQCYLCGCTEYIQREGHARDNKNLFPLECKQCRLVQLSTFEHIVDNFYEEAHMHDNMPIDIELLKNKAQEDTDRRFAQFSHEIEGKDILDFGCGTGDFLLKAKSIAKSVTGIEPERRLNQYFKHNNLTVYNSIDDMPEDKTFDVITLFHVLEHIKDPVSMLKRLKNYMKEKKKSLCIIEVPSSTDALLTLYKNKAFSVFTYWSCHLFLFNENTLKKCVEDAGIKTLKIEQFQRYPITNHLYWLAEGKPGGKYIYI